MIERRSILKALVALVAAPAIVKVGSLMKVAPTETLRGIEFPDERWEYDPVLDKWTQYNGYNYYAGGRGGGKSLAMREARGLWHNSNVFIRNIDRQYDHQFAMEGAKIGDVLRIRLPADYVVTDGPGLTLQDPAERMVYLKSRRTLVPESQVVDKLAVAAVAVAAVPQILKAPVTRRFWSLPQHSAAIEEG